MSPFSLGIPSPQNLSIQLFVALLRSNPELSESNFSNWLWGSRVYIVPKSSRKHGQVLVKGVKCLPMFMSFYSTLNCQDVLNRLCRTLNPAAILFSGWTLNAMLHIMSPIAPGALFSGKTINVQLALGDWWYVKTCIILSFGFPMFNDWSEHRTLIVILPHQAPLWLGTAMRGSSLLLFSSPIPISNI